jgi:hypothetical protein
MGNSGFSHWTLPPKNVTLFRQGELARLIMDVLRNAEGEAATRIGDLKRGLMIVFRVDQGSITSLSGPVKRNSLYIAGNPVIANEIIGVDLRASFALAFGIVLLCPISQRAFAQSQQPKQNAPNEADLILQDSKKNAALAQGFLAGVDWCFTEQSDKDIAEATLAVGVEPSEAATGAVRKRGDGDTRRGTR